MLCLPSLCCPPYSWEYIQRPESWQADQESSSGYSPRDPSVLRGSKSSKRSPPHRRVGDSSCLVTLAGYVCPSWRSPWRCCSLRVGWGLPLWGGSGLFFVLRGDFLVLPWGDVEGIFDPLDVALTFRGNEILFLQ